MNIFCQHSFVSILSSCRMDVIISDRNWLINFPGTFGPILGHHQGEVYITKAMKALPVHYNFVRIKRLSFILVLCCRVCFFKKMVL